MLVGSANWCVTLGRFNIHYAVSTLERYSATPREGHMKVMLKVFGYFKHHMKRQIIFNTKEPELDKVESIKQNWSELYPDAKKDYSSSMLIPKGKFLKVTTYFDADYA